MCFAEVLSHSERFKNQVQDVMKSDVLDVTSGCLLFVLRRLDGFFCSAGVCALTSHRILLICWYGPDYLSQLKFAAHIYWCYVLFINNLQELVHKNPTTGITFSSGEGRKAVFFPLRSSKSLYLFDCETAPSRVLKCWKNKNVLSYTCVATGCY